MQQTCHQPASKPRTFTDIKRNELILFCVSPYATKGENNPGRYSSGCFYISVRKSRIEVLLSQSNCHYKEKSQIQRNTKSLRSKSTWQCLGVIYIRHFLEKNFHWRGAGRGSDCGLRSKGYCLTQLALEISCMRFYDQSENAHSEVLIGQDIQQKPC